jgi:uncharacterized RmlC-like cupin family protein
MSHTTKPHPQLPELRQARLADPAALNAALAAELDAVRDHPDVYQTHALHGRFENTYVPAKLIPAMQPLSEWVLAQARAVLGREELRWGFWFNEMEPGHRTSLHAHEEDDELLSAVYYIQVPPESGRLVLWQGEQAIRIQPEAGMLLMFPPSMPHEVEENRSDGTRLSVAFNFGPPQEED